MRGQSSIEMLALTALFVSLLVPLLLFLFSSSSQLSQKGSLEGIRNSLLLLKEKIEYAYAFCPYRETFTLSIPASVKRIYSVEGGLVAEYEGGTLFEPLALSSARVDVALEGSAFSRPVEVLCSSSMEPVVEVRPA